METNLFYSEERADNLLSARHNQNLKTLISLERKRINLESRPNPTQTDKLKVLKLWFIGELLICSIINKGKKETENGLIEIDENQREKNLFQNHINKINLLLLKNNDDDNFKFINSIKSEI